MSNRDIYVAVKTFRTQLDGKNIVVVAGKTFVRAGHALLEGREALFKKVVPHYEVDAPKPSNRPKTSKKPEVTPERVEAKADEEPDEETRVTELPYSLFVPKDED